MIKKKCSVENGVPTQVVTATVLNKPKGIMSVATKVLYIVNFYDSFLEIPLKRSIE